MFAGGLLSLYLVQISSVAIAGYDLERLEEERQTWLSRNQQLEVELAKRHSLAWAEAQAVQHMGMTRSELPIFLAVSPPDSESDLESADSRARSAKPTRGRTVRSLNPVEALRAWFEELLSRRP
jgi:hypothetical protein